jgi:integrase
MPTELTPKIVAGLKPKPDQIVNMRDGSRKGAGLELRIFPSGERRWAIRYRVGARQRRLTLGDAAIIPLGGEGGARDLARKALQQVANGLDPMEEKREKREADTVGEFAEVYMERHAKAKKKSWKNDRAILKADILPEWKNLAMRDAMTRRNIRELLRAIVDRGSPVHANRVHALLSTFCRVAVEEEVLESNPVWDVPKPAKESPRSRSLSPEEIRSFWTATETMPKVLQAVWRLRLYTGQRPQEETAQAQWGEFDLDDAWWTIPGTKTKNKRAHRVPLSAPAVALLRGIRPAQPKPDAFVFTPLTNDPLVRTGKHFLIENFQPKDLRTTARTLMTQDHIPERWIEEVQNHKPAGISKHYNLHGYDAEKRQALDHWARRIDAIITEGEGSRVLPFAARA